MDRKLPEFEEVEEKTTPFQEFLNEYVAQLQTNRKGHRFLSDTVIARRLGIKQATFSSWINGVRTPDYHSAILLAEKLGPGVFDVLGYPRLQKIEDPKLKYIVEVWPDLDSETRDGYYRDAQEEVQNGGRKPKPNPVPFRDDRAGEPGTG
jgi:transcriptional regulator with XRE-family HTH domain